MELFCKKYGRDCDAVEPWVLGVESEPGMKIIRI